MRSNRMRDLFARISYVHDSDLTVDCLWIGCSTAFIEMFLFSSIAADAKNIQLQFSASVYRKSQAVFFDFHNNSVLNCTNKRHDHRIFTLI